MSGKGLAAKAGGSDGPSNDDVTTVSPSDCRSAAAIGEMPGSLTIWLRLIVEAPLRHGYRLTATSQQKFELTRRVTA